MVPVAPGSPSVQGTCGALTLHSEGSLDWSAMPLMTSGSLRVGSRPTLVRTSFLVRVVPVAVGPTFSGFGLAESTGPYPDPEASSGAGAPSEAVKLTRTPCGP